MPVSTRTSFEIITDFLIAAREGPEGLAATNVYLGCLCTTSPHEESQFSRCATAM